MSSGTLPHALPRDHDSRPTRVGDGRLSLTGPRSDVCVKTTWGRPGPTHMTVGQDGRSGTRTRFRRSHGPRHKTSTWSEVVKWNWSLGDLEESQSRIGTPRGDTKLVSLTKPRTTLRDDVSDVSVHELETGPTPLKSHDDYQAWTSHLRVRLSSIVRPLRVSGRLRSLRNSW